MSDFKIAPTGAIIREYLEDNNITQKDLADLCGYSEKQVSQILNGKLPLSEAFANAMEKALPEVKADYWLNYDRKYQVQKAQDEAELKDLNYPAWSSRLPIDKLFKGKDFSKREEISILQKALGIKTYEDPLPHYHYASKAAFLRDDSKRKEDNQELLDIWMTLCLYFRSLKTEEILKFQGKDVLKEALAKYKPLFCVTSSEDIIRNLRYFSKKVGINLILTEGTPTTYVRGACLNEKGDIFVIITSRFKNVEYVIFAFIHEMMHILSGDLDNDSQTLLLTEDWVHEENVSKQAKDYFITSDDYKQLQASMRSRDDRGLLLTLAQQNNTTPGMLISFLQHDRTIPYAMHHHDIHDFNLPKDEKDF